MVLPRNNEYPATAKVAIKAVAIPLDWWWSDRYAEIIITKFKNIC